jgi:cardiolipin synthase
MREPKKLRPIQSSRQDDSAALHSLTGAWETFSLHHLLRENILMDSKSEFRWLQNGQIALAEMLAAIEAAGVSIRLEMYIITAGPTAERFRQALVTACRRGVKVRALADGLGSFGLPESYWKELRASGGEFRWFNPVSLRRLAIRDHRKMLVCDETVAFIGGFNVAGEYDGDGVNSGWRDLGMSIHGPLARELGEAFDEMFTGADYKHKPFMRLRNSDRQKAVQAPEARLLLGAPGRDNVIKRALRQDLRNARDIQIMCAYFLPPWRMRRDLIRVARRGGRVQLILPYKTDVPMARLAAQSFYRRLLTAGVEIYEYEPQILHAKLFLMDGVVCAGSANFDSRSLNSNYELLVRLTDPALVREGREIFASDLTRCRKIDLETFRRSRTVWQRIKARFAYWILARIDPYIALRQFE